MHRNGFDNRDPPGPAGGAYIQRSPEPLVALKGEWRKGLGRGREGKGDEGKGKDPPCLKCVDASG